MNKSFETLYKELTIITNKLNKFYDIDKIKPYAVYVWNKSNVDCEQENIFDIYSNKVVFYVKNHKISNEAMIIIKEIQFKLLEIEKCY